MRKRTGGRHGLIERAGKGGKILRVCENKRKGKRNKEGEEVKEED